MSGTKYFITSTTGSFVEWESEINGLSIAGQIAVITGNSGKDWVYVGPWTTVDVSSLGDGHDRVYFTGKFGDYTQTVNGNSFVFTRTGSGQQESVTVAIQSHVDTLVFADGAVDVDLNSRLGGTQFNPIQAAELDVTVTTPPLANINNPDMGSDAVKVFITDPSGEHIPQIRPGSKLIVAGSTGVDSVYIGEGTNVDAGDLGAGQDVVYFTGNFADYGQSINGNTYTLTRTVGGNTETVEVAVQQHTDRLVFADGYIDMAPTLLTTGGYRQLVSGDLNPSAITPGLGKLVITGFAGNGGAQVVQSSKAFTFDVTFSEAVNVTGTPTLTLDINGKSTAASYTGGTGNSKLTFEVASTPWGDGNSVEITAVNVPSGLSITGKTTSQPLLTGVVGQTTTDLTIDDTRPVIPTTSLNADENGTAAGTVVVTDANDIVSFVISGGADDTLFTMTKAGVLTFNSAQDFENPGDQNGDGIYEITVEAEDEAGNIDFGNLSVNLQNVNEAPSAGASSGPAETVRVGQSVNLPKASEFTDPDAGDTLTYSATGLPNGLAINSTTGVIAGTPTTATNYVNVTVTATDAGGLSASQPFLIRVLNSSSTRTSSSAAKFVESGSPFTFDATYAAGHSDSSQPMSINVMHVESEPFAASSGLAVL
jgi:hypothetical protein